MTNATTTTIADAIAHLSDDPTMDECSLIQTSIFELALKAESLSELFDILKLQTELYSYLSSELCDELGVESGAWICDLPTFSDDWPTTDGMWSFDDTHAIAGEGWAEWSLVERWDLEEEE